MLSPKRVKYRKQHKGRRKGFATRGADISFGDFGLQALEDGWLTARQIEASRIAISRSVKRGGSVWVRAFPHKPVTKAGGSSHGFRKRKPGALGSGYQAGPSRF